MCRWRAAQALLVILKRTILCRPTQQAQSRLVGLIQWNSLIPRGPTIDYADTRPPHTIMRHAVMAEPPNIGCHTAAHAVLHNWSDRGAAIGAPRACQRALLPTPLFSARSPRLRWHCKHW